MDSWIYREHNKMLKDMSSIFGELISYGKKYRMWINSLSLLKKYINLYVYIYIYITLKLALLI